VLTRPVRTISLHQTSCSPAFSPLTPHAPHCPCCFAFLLLSCLFSQLTACFPPPRTPKAAPASGSLHLGAVLYPVSHVPPQTPAPRRTPSQGQQAQPAPGLSNGAHPHLPGTGPSSLGKALIPRCWAEVRSKRSGNPAARSLLTQKRSARSSTAHPRRGGSGVPSLEEAPKAATTAAPATLLAAAPGTTRTAQQDA